MSTPAAATQSETVALFANAIEYHLKYSLGKQRERASKGDLYNALALAVRETLTDRLFATESRHQEHQAKRVYYLSMEFLIGRLLDNNLYNLELEKVCAEAVKGFGMELEDLFDAEYDPALGNGGLGRLAACFLDSLATLGIPGFGYGINYEYGLFKQSFDNGDQHEQPDHWLVDGTPWQIEHPDQACVVPLYGHIEHIEDNEGVARATWVGWNVLIGVPSDMHVVGFGGKTVNYLRLYSARASSDFDMSIFNEGDYIKAVEQKISSETVSKVLYPSDSMDAGKELRLIQEYFFVACAIRDIIRRYLEDNEGFAAFPDKVAIQLNDTHPALAVADLMRALMDEHGLEWEEAWDITTRTLAYTNHTLLPEALERWSVPLMSYVLPRHVEIIYEINRRFLAQVEALYPGDVDRAATLSIIEESQPKQVRMANLAIVGSHSVNGVAELHSALVKSDLVPEFHDLWPQKFNNKTNGITPRRWLLKANPGLASLITGELGRGWITDLTELRDLEKLAERSRFREDFMGVKHANKEALARVIHQSTRISVDPDSMFDVQAKRIHEYKRQLLNAMHVLHLYLRVADDDATLTTPRTFVFAGKAAPGYFMAKLIIKLINSLGKVINADAKVRDQLRVAFVPDYKVSVAERLIPAADLSEQISTAGFEASGTGNMKFALNGALTVGTLDGANVEIMEEVGEDNIYIFGLKADEVSELRASGRYDPWSHYNADDDIKRVVDTLRGDRLCPSEPGLFGPIFDALMHQGDYYFHLADFRSYIDVQETIASDFGRVDDWATKAILNTARMAKFSSDRTIEEYANDIWGAKATV